MGKHRDPADAPHTRSVLLDGVKILVGLVPIVLAVACPILLPVAATGEKVLVSLLLCLLYVTAFRTDFESSRGSAVPTEPVLVAMLTQMPAAWIPSAVLVAVVIGSLGAVPLGPSLMRTVLATTRSAFSIAPAVGVVLYFDAVAPERPDLFVVPIAVGAQLVVDALLVLLLEAFAGDTRKVFDELTWAMAIDATLAVIGYSILYIDNQWARICLIAAPIMLVKLLSVDREKYIVENQTLEDKAQKIQSAYSEAEQEARRDPMTGLLNRRGWEETVEEVRRTLVTQPGQHVATVLVADLDRLKFANDTYGHHAGDGLICGFAELLTEHLPAAASVARLGGDEYAALVVTPAGEEAPDLTGLVRAAVQSAPPVGPVQLSASVGLATYPPATTLADAIDEADQAARTDKELRRMGRDHLKAVSA